MHSGIRSGLRKWLWAAFTAFTIPCAAEPAGFAGEEPSTIRAEVGMPIGLTPVFLDDELRFLRRWQDYLAQHLHRPISFVRRGNYSGITDLMLQGKLDYAWVCGYPYVRHGDEMRLLAVPLYQGRPLYQSYIIVPESDKTTQRFFDLRGRSFAYSDPDSNSGYLFPQALLADAHETGERFFSRSFFTWGHPRVVEAVAVGLADAGAVDGYVWETLAMRRPELTGRTRILEKSPWFGFPPFVARKTVPEAEFLEMQHVLVGMNQDPEGQALLRELNLDGFAPGNPEVFAGIRRNMAKVQANGNVQSSRSQPAP